ncbi:penicillin-binding protein 1A [Sphingomonas astaxanthinifaciens]|uniref:Penicillin-binding protein 1A n=1 Tax=Sphingomonas astaxanthinifaciens DSM 22298 TaxID=1123267 RepID=A0ABQ5Z6D3_9SPHN|nr:PBP1A family penicillin-binding protein [Sphingomonas astaxanthinifaciens]GLR47225.1 penicillin-binding protein [Sphingomonas astaxanthinifaciens DSM 22298]
MDAVATPSSPAWLDRHHRAADRLRTAWAERKWLRIAGWGVLGLYGLFILVWLFFAAGLPSSEKLLAYQPPLPTSIRGYDGQPVGTFARERRVELAYDEYPPMVVEAFISAEDKTFFTHGGIDYPGLVGAVGDFALKKATGGARARGGSTITQQVAKALLQDSSYNVTRKIREAILAFRLENVLTKQQILELYLNQIFLGRNAYGVQAAARAYFDKDVADLTLPEAAYLAVLPKAPSNYDPVRATEKALARRNYVLREMANNGYITPAQRDAAAATPLGTIRYGSNAKFREVGGYFTEEVRRELLKKYGEDAKAGPNSVYAGGLWVRTSMNPVMQDAAAEALREGLARFDGGRGWRDTGLSVDIAGDWRAALDRAPLGTGFPDWRKAVVLDKGAFSARIGFTDGSSGDLPAGNAVMPKRGGGGSAWSNLREGMVIIVKNVGGSTYAIRSIPEIGGGFIAEEVRTGRVLAMQGGFDNIGASYNRATQALRQPGSTFKPIVYYTAFANGMTPASIIDDAPFCVWQGAGLGNKCFKNFDAGYAGPKTLRWGVEQSRNLMTLRAASQTGMAKVTDTARRLGVGDYPNYLSISLGAGETTVMKLTNAYAILANHGRALTPTLIDYVQDRDGKVIFRTDNRCAVMEGRCNAPDWDGGAMPRPPSRSRQILDPQAAFQMVHVMTGVIERGTATVLRDLNRPLFGKTGTTNGPTNVWFIGGTPDVVAGTYLGYDQPRSMGGAAQGGRIAAPIFKQWAQTAFKDVPPTPFVAPDGIRMVRIDRVTGRRVFGTFPVREDPKSAVIWEAFKPETEPRRTYRPGGGADTQLAADTPQQRARAAAPKARATAAPKPQAPKPQPDDFLAKQGGIY